MDEDLILREIVKSLTFEIEAVNQDNVLTWATTNGTPLNVKVRVRNKDEPRLIQKGVIPVPRIGITAPEKLRLISSDQTILSFNVYLDSESEKEPKRHNGLKLFNIASCLGTYSDDEGPYLPSSSEQNAVESGRCSKSSSGILKKKVSPVLSTTNTIPRTEKRFFGKCKPGGCLDPPFDEDNYAYTLSKPNRQENIRIQSKEREDNKNTCVPGGCLDPPFAEDKYPYTVSNTLQPENLESISHPIKDEKQIPSNKTSQEHNKSLDKKTMKEEDDSKKLTDIFATSQRQNSPEQKYSNSLITYPTDVSSNETLDQIPNKKISIRSNEVESQRQSYDYPVSYFVPPKDIKRHKEEERRYSRRLSSDSIDRTSKSTDHDIVNKTKNSQDYIPQYITAPKNMKKEDMQSNYADNVTLQNDYSKQSDTVRHEDEHSIVDIPSRVITNSKVGSYQTSLNEIPASKYLRSPESNINRNEPDDFESKEKILSTRHNQNLNDLITSQNPEDKTLKTNVDKKPDKSLAERVEIRSEDRPKDMFPQSKNTGSQNANSLKARTDKQDITLTKPSKSHLKDISVVQATIPVLATATLALSEEQPSHLDNKQDMELGSSVTENHDMFKKSADQKNVSHVNETKYLSPQSISSSENNEFDVSSEHSIDFKQDISNNVEVRNQENTLGHKEKEALSRESLNLTNINNSIVGKNILRDDHIKPVPESEIKRTSAILQKKVFTAKHDLDIEYNDINKVAPPKRNTFTVIASDTSIQKSDEVEQIPENITNVYIKSPDVPTLSTPNLTTNNTTVTETKTKKEGEIRSSPRATLPGNITESHSIVNNEIKATRTDSRTKESKSTFCTDVDGSSHTSENLTNMNQIITHTKPNMTSNDNGITAERLRNQLPMNIRDKNSRVGKSEQNPLKIETLETKYQGNEDRNTNYKEIDILNYPEDIQDMHFNNDKPKTLEIETTYMEKPSKSVKDSLHKALPEDISDLHPKVSVSDKSAVNYKTENVDLARSQSEKLKTELEQTNADSTISVLKKNTDNISSNKMTDSKLSDDLPTNYFAEDATSLHHETILGNKSASFTIYDEQPELAGINDVEIKNGNKLTYDEYTPQKPLTNNLHSENGKYISNDPASHMIEVTDIRDKSNAVEWAAVIPELAQDLNYKNEQKYFDHTELEKVKQQELATDLVPNTIMENVDNMQALTTGDDSYSDFDQIYHENKPFDTHNYDYEIQKKTQKVSQLPNLNNELFDTHDIEYNIYGLIGKPEIVKRNSLPSGGYSGLLSEVLSNISEDREGEEINAIRNISLTDNIGKHEDDAQLEPDAYHHYEKFENKFSSISKEHDSKRESGKALGVV
ncbi:uncharacterized protein LOC125233913 [Leguminivora glycinivorella]|uniref:uncharacterized protein LOC125233913 n=1 Tax=Leguminivora glycinivorella TaxID=1035111 RepID=UPI00200EA8FF|nr:uncharacterized protein LOC125233913 [Leguminivora glycinivorella]